MIDWVAKWRADVKKSGVAPKLDDASARTRYHARPCPCPCAGRSRREGRQQRQGRGADRLGDYVKSVLTAKERAALKVWLAFLADNAREPAKNARADEVSAAKLLHNDFKPLAGFLKQLQGLVP